MYYLKNEEQKYLAGFHFSQAEVFTSNEVTNRGDALGFDKEDAERVLDLLNRFDCYNLWRLVKVKNSVEF